MRYMGWSWSDLCAAPAQLVQDILTMMAKDSAIQAERRELDEMKRRQAARRGR